MKKRDDELKIDISEIFGGDVTPLQPKTEEPSSLEPGAPPSESELNYQAFIEERNKLLEVKTAEIESSLPVPLPPVEVVSQSDGPPPLAEPSAPPEIVSEPVSTPTDPEIDFNAPMAPPFTGPDKPNTASPIIEGPVADSIAQDAKALKAEAALAEAEMAAAAEAEAARVEAARLAAENAEAARKLTLQKEQSFFLLFDEYRAIIDHELKDLVGERKTRNMLAKTFEIAREKYMDVFRNANWDPSGNLLEDGSLDGNRMAENAISLEESHREITVDMALVYLMNLRFQAIEKGLGAGFKNKLRARLLQWVVDKAEGANRDGKDSAPFQRLKHYLS